MATIVFPENHFPDADADAEAIWKACKGWGTDEKALISVLAHRNATQRMLIRHAYQENHHEDLIKRLESELSGHFERAVYRWILEPADRDAVLAHVAIHSEVPDYQVIVELSCIRTPEELLALKNAYQFRYKRSFEEDVAVHTFGDVRKLLVGLVSVHRYNGSEINKGLAKSEAGVLRNAIEEKAVNNAEVIRIVTTRSKAQVIATLNHYKDDHGSSITKHLVDKKVDAYSTALRTAVRCINDPKKYYEKVLRHAINKPGTDEDALTRVIVTRAEKDLKEIKELYYKRNCVSVNHAISKHTSGDYKDFLLALLGKE